MTSFLNILSQHLTVLLEKLLKSILSSMKSSSLGAFFIFPPQGDNSTLNTDLAHSKVTSQIFANSFFPVKSSKLNSFFFLDNEIL